jgi:hypothetical protein
MMDSHFPAMRPNPRGYDCQNFWFCIMIPIRRCPVFHIFRWRTMSKSTGSETESDHRRTSRVTGGPVHSFSRDGLRLGWIRCRPQPPIFGTITVLPETRYTKFVSKLIRQSSP